MNLKSILVRSNLFGLIWGTVMLFVLLLGGVLRSTYGSGYGTSISDFLAVLVSSEISIVLVGILLAVPSAFTVSLLEPLANIQRGISTLSTIISAAWGIVPLAWFIVEASSSSSGWYMPDNTGYYVGFAGYIVGIVSGYLVESLMPTGKGKATGRSWSSFAWLAVEIVIIIMLLYPTTQRVRVRGQQAIAMTRQWGKLV